MTLAIAAVALLAWSAYMLFAQTVTFKGWFVLSRATRIGMVGFVWFGFAMVAGIAPPRLLPLFVVFNVLVVVLWFFDARR